MAASCRDRQRTLEQQLKEERRKWADEQKNNRAEVTPEIIAECVAKMTGIPVQRIGQEENQRLRSLGSVHSSKHVFFKRYNIKYSAGARLQGQQFAFIPHCAGLVK